jgi:2-polyprenyl-6-methoxyphenol hydroxylase-like FAD-dependent oxidoreductase
MQIEQTDVLIVGGGPVGLSMAIELGRRGIKCTLVEQGDGTIEHPRTGLIAIRTMEMFRQWGLVERVRQCGFPEDYELSMFFCTSMNGLLLDVERYPSMRDAPTPSETPEKKQRCPQLWLQPILLEAAKAQPSARIRLKHRYDTLDQDRDGVTATITDLETGQALEVRSRYVIACDGFNSRVRDQLGIAMPGRLLSYSVNMLIHAPNLLANCKMGLGERYIFVGPEGTWGNLTVVDGKDIWRITVLGSEQKIDLASFDAAAWVRRAIGRDDVVFKIDSTVPWRRSETLADKFHAGRVVLAGDALHTMSPTGGMGMNTGMQEVMDLGWKLEALIRGWGGPRLLESYESERKPVAARNIGFSTSNFRAWTDIPSPRAVCDETPEGEETRRLLGARLRESTRVEWESVGLQLGHRYENSPICVADGTPPTPDDYSTYIQTARPGSRAPHAWLRDGRSTLDLFGKGFVLLAFDDHHRAAETALVSALEKRGVPVTVQRLDEHRVAELYERPLVLVRPDGHVAWRGEEVADPVAVADTVRGMN